MFEFSLVKIKILFGAIIVLIVAVLSVGSFGMPQSVFFTESYLAMMLKYPWYELTLSDSGRGGFFASLLPVSQSKERENGEKGNALSIPVLVYHGIEEEDGNGTIDEKRFREHMRALKDAGWDTVSMAEFQAFMKEGRELPAKSFLLTFDDGRKDSFYPVDPILRALDYEAVIFVIGNQSLAEQGQASKFYLSETELRHMKGTGRWDIESHGKRAHDFYPLGPNGEEGHFYSNLLWIPEEQRAETPEEFQDRVYEDLRVSKEELEASLGNSVSTIAFPFGDFGHNLFVDSNFETAQDILLLGAEIYYAHGFYQWWEGEGFTHNYRDKDTFLVKRIEPKANWSAQDVVAALEHGNPKTLPYTDDFSRDVGWLSTWGGYDIIEASDELVFRANPGETGASAILDGSGAWQNYEVEALVESPTQTGVFLWVRFQDAENNAACNFGENFAHVEQVLNGERRVIQGVRDVSFIPEGEFRVGARVQGRNVQCLINGEVIVETSFLDEPLDRGGIGFKMWDEETGRAALLVKRVEIRPL